MRTRRAAPLIALLPIVACATVTVPAPLCWRSEAPPTGDEDLGLAMTHPSLASNGSDDVWLGWSDPGPRILRWTRGQWSPIAVPARPGVKAMGNPIVAAGPNGAVVIALRANGQDGTSPLHVARADGAQGAEWNWLGPPLISSAVPYTHVNDVAVTVDAAGFPVVAWSEEVHAGFGGLFVARWDGAAWKRTPDPRPLAAAYHLPLGVAVDGDNRIWLTWTEGGSLFAAARVRVARFDGSAWTNVGRDDLQTLVSPGGVRYPSLAVERDGRAWLAWAASPQSGTPSLAIARWNGLTWAPVTPPQVPDGKVRDVAMMLNGDTPTVGWSQPDASENTHLYLADLAGGDRWRMRFAGFHLAEGVSNVADVHLAPGPGGSLYVSWDEGGKDRRRNRLIHAYACAAGESPVAAPKAAVERDTWPKTVDEAARQIVSEMSPADKDKVRTTPESELIRFHHGWGMGIRNSMGLWRGNKPLLASCGKGERVHPDDCSMQIIRAVWQLLQQAPTP